MSLSDPTANGGQRPPNPAGKYFIKWQGKEAYWYYYDKDIVNPDPSKKGTNIAIPNPLTFIVLDQLNVIKGFNKKEGAFVYSNEVRNTKTDIMEVFVGGTSVLKGLYQDIVEMANAKKGEYAKSVYVCMKGPDGKFMVANLVLQGASLGSWIDFSGKNDLSKGCVRVTGFTNGKTGDIDYVIPTYTFIPLTPEQMQSAIDLDANILQPYLRQYLSMAPDNTPIQAPAQQPVQTQNAAPQQAAPVAAWPAQQSPAPVNNSLSNQPVAAPASDFSMQPQGQNPGWPAAATGASTYNPAPTPAPVQNQPANWNPNVNGVPAGLAAPDDLPF